MKNFRCRIRFSKAVFPAACIALWLLPFAQRAQVPNSTGAPDVARMEQIVQSYVAAKQFMGSVLVARGDDLLLDQGYGFADLEWDIANTPTRKFRLGSVTKRSTAASILLLEERGKLSVNDTVKKYMPNAPPA